jgi:hypothetical protein
MSVVVPDEDDVGGGRISKTECFFRKISSIGVFFTKGLAEWQTSIESSADPDSSQVLVMMSELVAVSWMLEMDGSQPILVPFFGQTV